MTTPAPLAVGVLQLDGRDGDRRARINDARTTIAQAAEQVRALDASCHMLVLPELWATGFFHFDEYASGAETVDGSVVTTIRDEAAERGTWIVGGSFVEDAGSRLHNTTVVVDDRGALVASYRKVHLFGYRSRETELLGPGDRTVVFDGPCGRIGVMTCYDLRFPELARDLVNRGAKAVVIVSAWPAARIAHWRTLLRARAIENQVWIIAANAAGVDSGVQLGGHSAVIAPDGDVVAEAGEDDSVLAAPIDLAITDRVREELPFVADNRYSVALREDD